MMASLSDEGKIIERFSRYSDQQIFYEFEVSDPVFYSENWGGEISFNSTDTKPYEYACHEGNYGLQGILGGYRRQEMDEKAASEDWRGVLFHEAIKLVLSSLMSKRVD